MVMSMRMAGESRSIGISGHNNSYSEGVPQGNWVEELADVEASYGLATMQVHHARLQCHAAHALPGTLAPVTLVQDHTLPQPAADALLTELPRAGRLLAGACRAACRSPCAYWPLPVRAKKGRVL